MKTLNMSFTPREFKRLKNAREVLSAIGEIDCLTWEKFLMSMAREMSK